LEQPGAAAFTLVEVMVAIFIAAIFLPTFYACVGAGFTIAKETREDLRATQILLQRMEAIRLSPYSVLQNAASYPANVTEYFCPSGQATGSGGGAAYTVNYNWAPGPTTLPPSYRTNMLLVTATVSWNSGNVQRSRTNQTYVARYGIQRYVSGY
jgi:prepilin-type N-terminal cleavage/methylation domain-containing protein